MNEKRFMLIFFLIVLLLMVSPISAEIVTAKVNDKGLLYDSTRGKFIGTLHTEYGEITVNREDYNNIMVNDTIRYDTDMVDYFWTPFWEVEKVL